MQLRACFSRSSRNFRWGSNIETSHNDAMPPKKVFLGGIFGWNALKEPLIHVGDWGSGHMLYLCLHLHAAHIYIYIYINTYRYVYIYVYTHIHHILYTDLHNSAGYCIRYTAFCQISTGMNAHSSAFCHHWGSFLPPSAHPTRSQSLNQALQKGYLEDHPA